jgi:hypothetical protein
MGRRGVAPVVTTDTAALAPLTYNACTRRFEHSLPLDPAGLAASSLFAAAVVNHYPPEDEDLRQ